MRFWTRQHEAVWDELQKTGQYIVKKEYIEAKNDTISEFYLKLYEWYTKAARKYIDIPEVLKYPIWLSVSEDMILQPTEHAIIFEVEIPEGEYLICNFDKWGYRVNYFYVPLDEADEKAHMVKSQPVKETSTHCSGRKLSKAGIEFLRFSRMIRPSWSEPAGS